MNTMNNVSIATAGGAAAIVPAGDLRPTLFDEFIGFIDRPAKTTQTYIVNLRQFAAYLAYKVIPRPVRQDVIDYRDYLAAEHYAIKLDAEAPAGWSYRTDRAGRPIRVTCRANTISQYLRSVKQFFSWTAAAGYYPNIAANIHAPKIRHDTHRKDALQAADVVKIEDSIKARGAARAALAAEKGKEDRRCRADLAEIQAARLYAIYTLAVNAGLRTIEISRANVKDLELKNGRAVLYIWGKGHTEPDTRKPLAPEVYQAIRDYLEMRTDNPAGTSPLFAATGNRSGGKRLAPSTISRMLKQAMQAAGYDSERITAHTLRHTAGTAVQQLTNNLYLTQTYMRHANPATTEIYLHNETETAEADTAARLYDLYHGRTRQDAGRRRLEDLLDRMDPAQVSQLAGIAAAMAR